MVVTKIGCSSLIQKNGQLLIFKGIKMLRKIAPSLIIQKFFHADDCLQPFKAAKRSCLAFNLASAIRPPIWSFLKSYKRIVYHTIKFGFNELTRTLFVISKIAWTVGVYIVIKLILVTQKWNKLISL
jgi:hypothetical protein